MRLGQMTLGLIGAVFLSAALSAEPSGPPPEIREKMHAIKQTCQSELGDAHGRGAIRKLMRMKNENPSAISADCLKLLNELPSPPPR